MSKKRNILKEIINDIRNDLYSTFIDYLSMLENDNFGVEKKENFLVSKYEDILKCYKNREYKNENKAN